MISVTISAEDMDDVGDRAISSVDQGLVDAAIRGFERSQEAVPVDTGELQDSGELVVEETAGKVVFGYTADHAIPVEDGTEPHPITPDEADALVFEGDDGEPVFADSVDHPGTEPQPFMRPGFEAMVRELRQRGLSPYISGDLGGGGSP
jgi:hypothetical protein